MASLRSVSVLAGIAASLAAVVSQTATGVSVDAPGGATLVVEVASSLNFRLGVRFGGLDTAALPSLSLHASAPANFTRVAWGNMVGVQTAFGALLADSSGSGAWALYNTTNGIVVSSNGPAYLNNASATLDAGVVLPVAGNAAATGPGRACLGNGMFGPPFYYNRDAGGWAFVVSSSYWDPVQPHCYPASFDGSVGAPAPVATPALTNHSEGAAPTCTAASYHNETDATGGDRSSKYPNGLSGTTLASCCAACSSASDCIAFIWSDGTHPDPSGNCWPMASISGTRSTAGRIFGGTVPPPPPPPVSAWWAMGAAADWYLAPVEAPLAFTKALYDLTGAPAVPPRYAMGFQATYWGYETMEQVEGNMTAFRDGRFPIDSFIMDYDWWNTPNNANLDFGYDPIMFGPHTFIHAPNSTVPNATTTDACSLFAHFTNDIHMHFSGIRKPRTYSNIQFSNASGWLLPDSFAVGAGNNNWNMSDGVTVGPKDWFPWYYQNHTHFLEDGMSFWWLDEGETQWATYTLWNIALAAADDAARPNTRHYTINRSFQPGMQRFPAISWTGDRQDCSHTTVLSFTTAGQLYTACDMTAPDATILARQYWNAIFLPIMRVHAMHGTPRFPYLWGEEAANAMRAALNTRYAFLPHLYSLAHYARTTGQPIALPASYIFPNDPTFPTTVGDVTYMVSDVLLPADVCTSNGYDSNENTTHVNIPPGTWYAFNSTSALTGPQQDVTYTNVPLDQLVLFVREGAILTLNAATVQYTDQLGGDLIVQVYAGRDGSFTLVEDDGISQDYENDYDGATRRTSFAWNDATRTLFWTVAGSFNSGPNLYTTAHAVLFVANASEPIYAAPAALGSSGSVTF